MHVPSTARTYPAGMTPPNAPTRTGLALVAQALPQPPCLLAHGASDLRHVRYPGRIPSRGATMVGRATAE